MSTNYPSSLSDGEWDCLQRFLPPRSPRGKLRRHCLRTIFDAIFYLLRTGCPWRYLPSDFPPWQTVYYHFRQFCRTGLWVHLWRKRHLLVDTLGLPLMVYVTPADMHDTQGARRRLSGLKYFVPRLKKIWADSAYRGKELADWCQAQGDWDLEVVERTPGVRGFTILPKRWIVERTFGWLSRNRRMSKDYERKVQTSETLIEVAMILLLVVRLGCWA